MRIIIVHNGIPKSYGMDEQPTGPHICSWNAEEIGMSDCEYGCKWFRCSTCHSKSVVHNVWYGCKK